MTDLLSVQYIVRDLEDVPVGQSWSRMFQSRVPTTVGDRFLTQVIAIPKYSAEDTTLVVGNGAGETTTLAIPAGSRVTVDVVGLHYNRKTHLARQARPGCLRRVA